MENLNNKKNYIANRRAIQKAEDPEKYLRVQREYMKNYRKSKKIKKEPQINFTDTLVDKMELTSLNKDSPDINKSTLLTYGKNITRLYRMMYNTELKDLSFLEDVENVSTFIENKYNTVSTKLSYYKSINSFLRRIKSYEELAGKYANLQNALKVTYDKQVGTNKRSAREDKNYVPWSELIRAGPYTNVEDQLLFDLFTSIPPRRNAYKYLKYIKGKTKKQIDGLDKNYNYITVNRRGNPISIILNKYKTQKSYGVFKLDLTQSDRLEMLNFTKLRKSIKKYIKKTDIKSGELFFKNSKGEQITDFTRTVNDLFKSFSPKRIGASNLRHAYISHYMDKKNVSNNTINMMAKMLGHSPLETLSYRRFD